MASDQLYKLALEYRKTSLWKRMEEDQLFAVRLSGNRIGYVSVMGAIGEHIALAVYAGEEGLRSYHILREYGNFSEIEYSPSLQNHMSIQVSFEAKADLPEETLAEAREYAKRNGVRFAGKNAYPMFFKAEPGYVIWPELTEQDEEDLGAGLRAAIEVAKDESLKFGTPGEFPGVDRQTEKIVLMEEEDGSYRRDWIPLPKAPEYRPPEGSSWDELAAARIRKLPKHGIWQMGLVTMAVPIEWEHSDRPILPVFIVVLDVETDQLVHVRPVALYEERTQVMLNMLMNGMEEYGSRPVRIEVEDVFTEALLHSWCNSAQIKIARKQTLPELRDAKWSLIAHLGGARGPGSEIEELSMMIDVMLELSEEELSLVPPEIKEHLLLLEENAEFDPNFPEWLLEKLEELNDAIEEVEMDRSFARGDRKAPDEIRKPADKRKPGQIPALCVLSISLGTGCYRHIRVREDVLLEDLADIILWAFGFENDHAHAFFMDNRAWSRMDSYYSPGLDLFDSMFDERRTDEFCLRDTGLTNGKKFKFIFDFGDNWTFQCKVLRTGEPVTSEDQMDNAEIIRFKGEPPQQYGWEEWDDFDDFDD